jgi:hypothetical protein
MRGPEPTYGLLPDRKAMPPKLAADEALGRLANRYFASHGPATRRDFAWWAGLGARETGLALERARGVHWVGDDYWAAAEPPPCDPEQKAWLLPPFDGYLLGYRDRQHALDPEHARKVNAGGGMPAATVLLGGRVAGTWRLRRKGGNPSLTIRPFREMNRKERDLIAQAGRWLGDFEALHLEVIFAEEGRPRS